MLKSSGDYLKICAAAAAYKGKLLDRPIVLEHDTRNALDILRDRSADTITHFVDVPVRDIIGCGHLNFGAPPLTWRESIRKVGYGWQDGVINYFESAIRDADFPGDGARYGLRLLRHRLPGGRGPIFVENGIHRSVGLVNWMISTRGDESVVIQVQVCECPLRSDLAFGLAALANGKPVRMRSLLSTYSAPYRPPFVAPEASALVLVGEFAQPEAYALIGQGRETALHEVHPPQRPLLQRPSAWRRHYLECLQIAMGPETIVPSGYLDAVAEASADKRND
ncbi:hypothetical protein [Sinimarinibacterium flocculans]|uniref:Uncharacterized protein n=1 Tax=Sinimarinibacterium flocculans TaxID=985250 RepID=A0A318E9D8_9GAMM|nr:hypothetical protein [Sinimarinibacterium flocculans]PXV67243.1 hypothetical protein C8D93_106221 [Sinimarinibacterium flocculans]HBG31537.1 hypothetical protein [Gammaproteobacteria bacterium]